MQEETFQDCLKYWKNSDGYTKFWPNLAEKWDYKDGETLRQYFKLERKRRGIFKEISFENKPLKKHYNKPKVGILDIETLPGVGYFWSLWDQNIGLEQIIKDTCMLGWAGKFLNESDIYSDFMVSKEAINRDFERITKSCWEFISKCDILIGHNLSQFDRKYINTSFLIHDLPPLKYTVIDTLLVARQNMRFDSNKLSFINKKLGIRNKLENDGFPLWSSCSDGNVESLKIMQNYCEGDIYSTEELFYKLRPYIKNFNIALYNEIDSKICPVCGSDNLKSEGYYFTPSGKWTSYRCQECKCISRGKENLLSKDKKKNLLINS